MIKITISLFILGLSFGWGPCLASCGPLLISYIAATKKDLRHGLSAYAIFSLSRISAYFILSLLIFFLGKFLIERFSQVYSRYIFIVGGAFIVFVGIVLALGSHLDFGFLKKMERLLLERDIKSMIIFGLIIGFLPCAPLIAILSYIGLIAKSGWLSLLYSLSFGLGTFVSPLILLVMITGLIPKFSLEKAAPYYRIFHTICGLVMIFLGVQLIGRAF